jgi:hypothetical protein
MMTNTNQEDTMSTKISSRAARRLGTRATAYVEEHALPPCGRGRLVPDTERTPNGVARTLTRVYGRPWTVDRGEVAYWEIPSEDVEVEA